MSNLIFILVLVGIAYLVLFNRPKHVSVEQLQNWFSNQMSEIAVNLERDIELEKRGEYRHEGKQLFEAQGAITYTLLDKKYARFEISEKNAITPQDIRSTTGYSELESLTQKLGLSIRLDEHEVMGDGVEDFDELDEYIDDIPRYYSLTVSGW